MDIVGNNNGVPFGALSYTNGEVGEAFYLNGADAYVKVPANSSLDVGKGTGMTVEGWINPSVVDTTARPIVEWNNGSMWGVHLWDSQPANAYGTGPGCLYLNIQDANDSSPGGYHTLASPAGIVQANVYQHVAFTYDRATGLAVIYLNGQSVAQTTFPTNVIPQTSYDFYLGARIFNNPPQLWAGSLDEFSVYNRALSASEIQGIYAARAHGKCPLPAGIISQPASQTVYAGGIVSFSVVANGTPPLSYQWSFNGTNLVGAISPMLVLTNVQPAEVGAYVVTVDNSYGSATSSNAMLNVVSLPKIVSFVPEAGTVGTNVVITGSGFDSSLSNNVVYFGAVRAEVIAASTTNLTVIVPTGATYAPITETVNGLTAYADTPFLPVFPGGSTLESSSFGPQTTLGAGNGPARVAIGDLDGDGRPDVAVANVYDGSIWIYRNVSTNGTLGASSLASPIILSIGGGKDSTWGLALADLTGDGRLDIVVANRNLDKVSIFQNFCTPGNITTNSFGARVDLPVAGTPFGVGVADLDGDGRLDIIVADSASNVVSVLKNNGSGGTISTNTFAAPVNFAVGPGPAFMAVADLDGDGKPDVVVINSGANNNNQVSVLRNISTLGNVTFASAVDFPGLSSSYDVAIGDLDGDGKPDLAVSSFNYGQAVSIYRNTSTPGSITTNSFATPVDFGVGGWGNTVAIGDLDGDGKPDVAVLTQLPDHLSLFRNISTPGSFTSNSFAPRVDLAAGYNPNGMAIGDLDGDGLPDLVFGNSYDNTISLYQNVISFGGPPKLTVEPTNQTVKAGSEVTFEVVATGSQPLRYQWSVNGTNLLDATNSSLVLTNVQLEQRGDYSVLVTNPYGSTNSPNATLSVYTQDHFTWSRIPSPRFVGVPFTVTIQAQDATNGIATDFNGTVTFTATNGIPITPSVSHNFVQGVWSGSVTVPQIASNVVLRADDGLGQSGLANPISVISPPQVSVLRSGNVLLILWPIDPSGFVLETTDTLSPPKWIPVTLPPVQIGNQYLESIQLDGTNRFYRLRFTGP